MITIKRILSASVLLMSSQKPGLLRFARNDSSETRRERLLMKGKRIQKMAPSNQKENLRPYRMFGLTLLQFMGTLAIAGFVLTAVLNYLF